MAKGGEKANQYKVKQAHVELAEKMKKRDQGTAPNIGDRIPFVIIQGTKGSKNYENAEDPVITLDLCQKKKKKSMIKILKTKKYIYNYNRLKF